MAEGIVTVFPDGSWKTNFNYDGPLEIQMLLLGVEALKIEMWEEFKKKYMHYE